MITTIQRIVAGIACLLLTTGIARAQSFAIDPHPAAQALSHMPSPLGGKYRPNMAGQTGWQAYPNIPWPYGHATSGANQVQFVTGTFRFGGHVVWDAKPDPNGLYSVDVGISGTPNQYSSVSLDHYALTDEHWEGTGPLHWRVDYLIDSTMFANKSVIHFWAIVKSQSGINTQTDYYLKVQNGAYVLGNQTFDHPWLRTHTSKDTVDWTDTSATLAGYTTNINMGDDGMNDDVSTILANIPKYSLFYIDTHGDTKNMDDCFGDGGTLSHIIYTADVTVAMKGKTGNNPPQYTFVDLDACNTAGNPSLGTPITTDWAVNFNIPEPGTTSNQAFMGWDQESYQCQENATWIKYLWEDLLAGKTVYAAETDASRRQHTYGIYSWAVMDKTIAGWKARISPRMFGDRDCRIHGLYTAPDNNPWMAHLQLYSGADPFPVPGH